MITPLQAALLAERAYTDAPTFGKADSAGRAVVYGEAVGFPGTDNIACWLADLDAAGDEVDGMGVVHVGFWTAWLEISAQVLALDGVEVLLGHSEGAALALIAAAQLCLAGKPPLAVFAIEPPRVSADDTLAKLFAAHGVQLYLCRNGLDVVTDVPRLTRPWQHPAPLTAIGHASMPVPNIEDHLIGNVIKALTQLSP